MYVPYEIVSLCMLENAEVHRQVLRPGYPYSLGVHVIMPVYKEDYYGEKNKKCCTDCDGDDNEHA